MKQQRLKFRLVSLILTIAIAAILVAGCTGTASVKQGQATSSGSSEGGQVTAGTAAPVKATAVPTSLKTAQPVSTQAPSAKVLSFNPVSDKKTGDKFTITGTTSLPANTDLFWEIIPDPGTPPTSVDINAQIGIMANNYVLKENATVNRVALDVDTKDMKPGKYVVIVASLKGDPMTTDPSTGTLAGYTYFTLR